LYDYALIKIEKIIERDSYFTVKSLDTKTKSNVTVCGYSRSDGQYNIFHHTNEIQLTEAGSLYDIDTEKGQSGSPVALS
jgi:V8-like Glu-specific endopeptidase